MPHWAAMEPQQAGARMAKINLRRVSKSTAEYAKYAESFHSHSDKKSKSLTRPGGRNRRLFLGSAFIGFGFDRFGVFDQFRFLTAHRDGFRWIGKIGWACRIAARTSGVVAKDAASLESAPEA